MVSYTVRNIVSDAGLVGGGSYPQPGEISLAHNGVLFLDELPEFKRTVLEVMRQPMEERIVTISRARISVEYKRAQVSPAHRPLLADLRQWGNRYRFRLSGCCFGRNCKSGIYDRNC